MDQSENDPAHQSDETSNNIASSPGRGGLFKLIALAVVIVGLFVAFRFLPVGDYLKSFLEYSHSLGVWGPILLAVVYIVATVFMAPGAILTLGAGFTFGLVWGTLAVMAGSVLGAMASFFVGRTVARDFVDQKARQYPKFAAIDQAVEREGFKIVLLTRLSPIFPFNLLNYLFSITKVRTSDYFLASWIGMVPGTIMYVYLGYAAKDLTQIATGNTDGGWGQTALLVAGLIATIAVTVYITRIARKALQEYVPTEE